MPNNDKPAEPTPPQRPRAQPSLMGAPDAAARSGPDSDGGLRMLGELQSPGPSSAKASGFGGGKAVALLGALAVLVAAAWWWSHPGRAAPRAVAPLQVVQGGPARPVQVTNPAVAPGGTATEASTARIETTAEASVAQAVAATRIALAAPAPSAEARPPAAAAKPLPNPVVARPAVVHSANVAPRPAPQSLAAPAAAIADSGAAKTAKSGDPDVVLLSALLAHVARTGPAGTLALAEQDQLTIAQIVQRCEARGGEEARECRRRICDGYWGKAEACPAPATPKKG